jgi:hypothetical protein
MPEPRFFDEDTYAWTHGPAHADPASPGAAYVQAEVVALRTAIVAILAALRSAGIIQQD